MFRRSAARLRIKRPLTQRLYERFVHKYFAHDVNFELQRLARREAAVYIRRHMATANMYPDRWRLLQAAVGEARPRSDTAGGLFLEFGVEKGASANFIARLIGAGGEPAVLHAFDSFEGLPDSWDGTFETRGKFTLGGKIPRLLANVEIHKGWFENTLPGFRADHQGSTISLLHIDCDLYSSTRTVLEQLGDLLLPGSIVVFDEYLNYHGWKNHEFKAWQEFVEANRVKYSYRGFCGRGGQVFMRIDEIQPRSAIAERFEAQLAR
jgi:hypothetical protein